jgi:hypothetical protein
MDYRQIACKLYNKFWQLKHEYNKFSGQRFAPTVNKQASNKKIIQSVDTMAAVHHAFKTMPKDRNQMHYFVKAINIFSNSACGVHHAGHLLSQHLLVMGSMLGIYPSIFSTLGVIGETRCQRYLNKHYNLFGANTEITNMEESDIIL